MWEAFGQTAMAARAVTRPATRLPSPTPPGCSTTPAGRSIGSSPTDPRDAEVQDAPSTPRPAVPRTPRTTDPNRNPDTAQADPSAGGAHSDATPPPAECGKTYEWGCQPRVRRKTPHSAGFGEGWFPACRHRHRRQDRRRRTPARTHQPATRDQRSGLARRRRAKRPVPPLPQRLDHQPPEGGQDEYLLDNAACRLPLNATIVPVKQPLRILPPCAVEWSTQ